MKKITLLLLIMLLHGNITACSAFFFNSNSKLLAKNFDWGYGEGYLMKNVRGKQKYAYGLRGNNVAGWLSKYGSITFNQIGKEFPYGGINEKGLVIEQLWLGNTEYQENNNKAVSELEWIQYQLDNYENVDEVIKNINNLTIKPIGKIHYFLADKNGVSAVIDFVNGKVNIDRKQGKLQVITNETSEDSKIYFEKNKNIDPKSRTAFDRYCTLRNNLDVENLDVPTSFAKLELVKENEPVYKSYWSVVYDLDNLKIYFKSVHNPNIKTVSLSDFDFDKNSNPEFSLINANEIDFHPYTSEYNHKFLSDGIRMMNIEIDVEKANEHQMHPDKIVVDEVFKSKYTDLLIEFFTKKTIGNIWFMIIDGEENFKTYNGFISGILPVTNMITRKILYAIPKGSFALACFQDIDFDNKMEKNILGIPVKTGFSNNKKKIFGIPPNYETAKFNLNEPQILQIKID